MSPRLAPSCAFLFNSNEQFSFQLAAFFVSSSHLWGQRPRTLRFQGHALLIHARPLVGPSPLFCALPGLPLWSLRFAGVPNPTFFEGYQMVVSLAAFSYMQPGPLCCLEALHLARTHHL